MVKKIGISLLLLLAAQYTGRPQGAAPTGSAFAQLQDDGQPCPPECVTDSMEIVTWYPSPYSEYEELRLYPISESNSQCSSDTRGLMYYDSDEDKVKLCKGPAGLNNWQDLGGDTWTHDGTVVRLTTFTDTVGIGTANPQAKLEVVGGEVRIPGGSGDLSDFATAFRYLGTGANYIRGNTYIADNGGNVGIGTTSPATKLHVNGIITVPTGSSSGGLKFSGNSQIYEDSDGLHFRKMGGTDYKFKFEKDNGTVIAKLDNAGDLFVDGDVYARSVKLASDIKIKKDISDITDALSVINKLHPVRYRLIDKFLKEHESFKDTDYYNFIAQEFEKIFPDSVTKGDDGYLRIDIHNVSIYLTAAVQELSRITDALKKANTSLESRINALEEKLGSK